MKLIGEFVARPAHPAAVRASALDHELRDHTMENQPVIERPLFLLPRFFVGEFLRTLSQPHKIGNRLGRFLFIQPNHDISLRSLKNGVGSCRSAHAFSLSVACAESSYTSRTLGRHSPALLLAQLRNVRRVMLPVPFVEKENPVNRALATLRMNQRPRKLLRLERPPDAVPAI